MLASASRGGVCSGGSARGGGLLLGGCLLPGVSAPRGGLLPACTEADPPHVDRITDACKNIILAQLRCGRCKVFINPPIMVCPGGVNHNAFIVMVCPGGANHNDKSIMINPPLLWLTPPICDGLSVLRY